VEWAFSFTTAGKEATLAKLLLHANEWSCSQDFVHDDCGISAIKMEQNRHIVLDRRRKVRVHRVDRQCLTIAAWTRHAGPESAGLAQSPHIARLETFEGGVVEFFFHFRAFEIAQVIRAPADFSCAPC
jgi:hypothetical protein